MGAIQIKYQAFQTIYTPHFPARRYLPHTRYDLVRTTASGPLTGVQTPKWISRFLPRPVWLPFRSRQRTTAETVLLQPPAAQCSLYLFTPNSFQKSTEMKEEILMQIHPAGVGL